MKYDIHKGGTYDMKELLKKLSTQEVIPQKLYKYNTINDNFFKLIESNSCWFSKPEDFNDPFDCRINFNIGNNKEEIMLNMEKSDILSTLQEELIGMSDEVIKLANEVINNRPALFKKVMNGVHQIYINQNIGVYCLTENSNNILMWSHYASSHTGVCIEFEIERNGFFYKNLLPVLYEKKYPKFELSRYIDEKNMLYTMHQQIVCTKSKLWEYEQEWRVIVDDGFGLKTFKKEDITKIIFGVNTPNDKKEKVVSLMKSKGYTKTKFFYCELSDNMYKLNLKKYQYNK